MLVLLVWGTPRGELGGLNPPTKKNDTARTAEDAIIAGLLDSAVGSGATDWLGQARGTVFLVSRRQELVIEVNVPSTDKSQIYAVQLTKQKRIVVGEAVGAVCTDKRFSLQDQDHEVNKSYLCRPFLWLRLQPCNSAISQQRWLRASCSDGILHSAICHMSGR